MNKFVQILSEEMGYQGHFQLKTIKLRYKQFDGGWSQPVERELFECKSSVGILLYDSGREQFVLIEQVRIGALADNHSPWLLEIVAGNIEVGEMVEEVAHREAQEETGLAITGLQKMCEYWVSPGGSNERFTLFLAEVDAHQAGNICGLEEEDEDIKVHVIEVDKALTMLDQGEIKSSPAIIALQWFALHHKK